MSQAAKPWIGRQLRCGHRQCRRRRKMRWKESKLKVYLQYFSRFECALALNNRQMISAVVKRLQRKEGYVAKLFIRSNWNLRWEKQTQSRRVKWRSSSNALTVTFESDPHEVMRNRAIFQGWSRMCFSNFSGVTERSSYLYFFVLINDDETSLHLLHVSRHLEEHKSYDLC